jgi:hypothetical protein
MLKSGSVQYFAIDVIPVDGGDPWRVYRRYNQFYELSQNLNRYNRWNHRIITPFPRKHFGASKLFPSDEKLERRRLGLESWLSSVIAAYPSVPAWTTHLKSFLEAPDRATTALPVAESLPQAPVAPPSAPPAQEPPQPMQNSSNQSENLEGMMMEITVPSGVSPGQVLGVSVPSGEQLLLEVPAGALAGQVVQVWYDPVQGSLKPSM